MKIYYEPNNWSSSLAYYRIEGKVVQVVYEIIRISNVPMTQCVYNLASVSKYLQNPATVIRYKGTYMFINDNSHNVEYISTYCAYRLELNTNQFTRRLEIK